MINEFSKITGVAEADLLGTSRKKPLIDYRHVYWWLLYQSGFSFSKIGRLNGIKHTTVMKAIDQVETLMQLGDREITDIFEKVKPLTEKLRDVRFIMSILKQVIELTPPTNTDAKNCAMPSAISNCHVCHGKGYIYKGGYRTKFKNDLTDPDYTHCSVCGGTGKIKALVTVTWSGVGEVVELPNESELPGK